MDLPGLSDAGISLTRSAQQRADQAANRLVHDPTSAESIVDLERSTHEGEIGAKLLKAYDEQVGTLLDVLA